jgi:lysophospholipase L1-like esterase
VPTTSLREKARLAGLVLASLAIGLIALELGLRAANGWLGTWPNFVLAARTVLTGFQASQYVHDDRLGYLPRPGHATDSVHIGADGLRVTGDALPGALPGAPILAVGDSYTYGEEVTDAETWPAHLQALLGRRVLNAGVAGFGFDQIVLRAEALAPALHPSAIVVSFIADDLRRTEFARLWSADKPWFDIADGKLVLRGVPVPPRTDPRRTLSFAQKTLGYSYLVDFVMRRLDLLEDWFGDHVRVHPAGTGEQIACRLTRRLAALQKESGAPLLLVAQYDPYVFKTAAFGQEQRGITGRLLDCARAQGLKVLDTFDAIEKSGDPAGLYGQWHMNDKGNALMAARIAQTLRGALP